MLDRALALFRTMSQSESRLLVDFYWKADTRPLHDGIDSILATNPGSIPDAADTWFSAPWRNAIRARPNGRWSPSATVRACWRRRCII